MMTKNVFLFLAIILGVESGAINREIIAVQRNPFYEHELHPGYCIASEVFLKPRMLSSEEFDDAVGEFNVYGPPQHTHPWIQPISTDPEDDGYAIKPKPVDFLYVQPVAPRHDFPAVQDRINVERSVLTEEAKYICSPELNEELKTCSNDVRRKEVLKHNPFCSCDDAPIIAPDAENVEKSELTEETKFIFDEELPEKEYVPSNKASEFSVIEMNPEIDDVKNTTPKRKKVNSETEYYEKSRRNPKFKTPNANKKKEELTTEYVERKREFNQNNDDVERRLDPREGKVKGDKKVEVVKSGVKKYQMSNLGDGKRKDVGENMMIKRKEKVKTSKQKLNSTFSKHEEGMQNANQKLVEEITSMNLKQEVVTSKQDKPEEVNMKTDDNLKSTNQNTEETVGDEGGKILEHPVAENISTNHKPDVQESSNPNEEDAVGSIPGDPNIMENQEHTFNSDMLNLEEHHNQEVSNGPPETIHIDEKLMYEDGQEDVYEGDNLGHDEGVDDVGEAEYPVKIENRNKFSEDTENVPKNGGASLKAGGGLFSSSLL